MFPSEWRWLTTVLWTFGWTVLFTCLIAVVRELQAKTRD